MKTKDVALWLEQNDISNYGLDIDRNHRISLYLSDVLNKFQDELKQANEVKIPTEPVLPIQRVSNNKVEFKCELERWFYSCSLYNINKGCKNCEYYK